MNNKDKRVLTIIVLICFVSMSLCVYFDTRASADAMTVGMLASAAYAYAQSAGLNFGFTNGTSSGAVQWMENRINSWLAGRTIIEAFGSEVLRVSAGKLIIPASLAMNLATFIQSIVDDEGLQEDTPKQVSQGTVNGYELGTFSQDFVYTQPASGSLGICMFRYNNTLPLYPDRGASSGNYGYSKLYVDGKSKHDFNNSGYFYSFKYWMVTRLTGNNYRCYYCANYATSSGGTATDRIESYDFSMTDTVYDTISLTLGSDYELPSYPDFNYQWEGTIDGSLPDTNLDQLLDLINDDIADNNLDVDGEVVNPQPVPTPVPTYPPIDDVIEGINEMIEQGNDIIINQGTMSSAIERAAEAAEEATEAIEEALDIPTADEIPLYKFDLRTLFPFCIPFDIYNLLQAFDGVAAAPRFQIPIVIQSIGFSYTMDLDFSAFDSVAAVLRQVELIAFAIALAFGTSKVIRW